MMSESINISDQENPQFNLSENLNCFNSSYNGAGLNASTSNQSICFDSNEDGKSVLEIAGIVIVSIILGLMTLTTIVGKC